MKTRLLYEEVYERVISISTIPNGAGRPFIESRLYATEQLNRVKTELILLLNDLNSLETQKRFPQLYTTEEPEPEDVQEYDVVGSKDSGVEVSVE